MPRKMETQAGKPNRDVNAAARAALALNLRLQGLDYEEIAKRAGYANKGVAYKAIQRELQRRIVPAVDALRQEESARLDKLLAAVWPLALGDPKAANEKLQRPNLFAVDRVLAISQARRQLLGLDAKGDSAPAGVTFIREYPPGATEAV